MKRVCIVSIAFFVCIVGSFATPAKEEPRTQQTTVAESIAVEIFRTDLHVFATPADYQRATGKTITTYNEAPDLKQKVSSGVLPAVKQRLPLEPMVIKPVEQIGKYGGTLYQAGLGPHSFYDFEWAAVEEFIGQFDNKASTILPAIAKGWELSPDKKTVTIRLREGHKWSDGQPFTTDDIMFWWEDVALNKEINPRTPTAYTFDDKLARFEKVDATTLKIHFPIPNPTYLLNFAHWGTAQSSFFHPKHYLTKWHIKYNKDADKLAKDEGFDNWWQAFNYHATYGTWARKDLNLPTVAPFMLVTITPDGNRRYVRNPYYFCIDTAGNQLPYIDEVVVLNIADQETFHLKAIAGEISFAGFMLTLENFPLYRENADKGNYRVLTYQSPYSAQMMFGFNMNHKDPVLAGIFQDKRFRQASSLAINRDEINEVVFFGLATPTQITVDPACSYYKKEWGEAYVEYDPETANRLLDEMGLRWDSAKRYRLRPDGKPLNIVIEHGDEEAPFRICELVKNYWAAIGINAEFKKVGRALYYEHLNANEYDVALWHSAYGGEVRVHNNNPYPISPASESGHAREWHRWRTSNGQEGIEPPTEIKDLFAKLDRWATTTPDEADYTRLAHEIFGFQAENLLKIGTVGYAPVPIVVKNNLRNVPMRAYWGADALFTGSLLGMQWFFD